MPFKHQRLDGTVQEYVSFEAWEAQLKAEKAAGTYTWALPNFDAMRAASAERAAMKVELAKSPPPTPTLARSGRALKSMTPAERTRLHEEEKASKLAKSMMQGRSTAPRMEETINREFKKLTSKGKR